MGCGTVFLTAFIGLILFGPPGAIIGLFIGFIINNYSSKRSYYQNAQNQQRYNSQSKSYQLEFYKQFYGMLAKFAQADGAVTRKEISIIDNFTDRELNLPHSLKEEVIKLFDEAKRKNISFETYATKFAQMVGNQPHVLGRVLEFMDRLADANGGRSEKQIELLGKAASIFGLNRSSSYRRRNNSYQKSSSRNEKNISGSNRQKDPYEILGCSRDDSTKEIKKKYRKLVKEYHPDRIISKDLPDDFVELANKRFKEIQDAYEEIMEMRGKK